MTLSRTAPLLVLTAALLLGAGWWLGRQSEAPGEPVPAPAAGDTGPGAPAASVGATADPGTGGSASVVPAATPLATAPAAATIAAAPLPPPGTRVTEMFEELRERARRGDARAACRLASDLQRCRWMPGRGGYQRDRRPDGWESRIAEMQDEAQRERMIRMMAEMETRRDENEQICEGVTPAQIDEAFALQMQAAAALPELRVQAALAPALDRMFPGSEVERWQQYRPIAQSWLEQAAAEGDLSAIIALARVHGDDRRPGPPIPPYRDIDDARFVTYAALLERYGVSIPPVVAAAEQARARLAPEALQRAEARADALYRPAAAPSATQREAAMRQSFGSPFDSVDCD